MFRVIPLAKQIKVVERMIGETEIAARRRPLTSFETDELAVLKSLARDLHARKPGADVKALCDLEDGLTRLAQARLPDGEYELGYQRNLVIRVITHWPALRTALLAQTQAATGAT